MIENKITKLGCLKGLAARSCLIAASLLWLTHSAMAREVEYKGDTGEINVYLNPGEPTQVSFPGKISGGFKKRTSMVALDRKDKDLIIFGNDALTEQGEAVIVRLEDGRSYSLRARRSTEKNQRDDFVSIYDDRGVAILSEDDEEPPYKEKKDEYAPPTQVSGLMREMVLATEFGKNAVPGYRKSDKYKGELVINDGTLIATVESIFIGPNLWGYVLDASNLLDQTQKVNPATFRLDGTRAISMTNWELAPKPYSIEQQVARKHTSKVYIITRAKTGSAS